MNILLVIIGMMAVTYLPRLIPFLAFSQGKLPESVRVFLSYIPYAALGALIVPGGFTAIPNMPAASSIALLATVIFSVFNKNIIVTVVFSIITTFFLIIYLGM